MAIRINYDKCCWKNGGCNGCICHGVCKGCAEVCPVKAIKRKDKVIVDNKKCISCGACVNICKHKAISLIK